MAKGKDGKFMLGSSKDESIRGQAKGAAKSFAPAKPAVSTAGGKNPGKGFTNAPAISAQAPKVSGAPGAASKNPETFGKGRKLGNHYSNS